MLNLDWATIAFQVINFLVLAGLLYRFVLRPVMGRVQERRAEKGRLMEQIRQDRREAERVRRELGERLAAAEEEAERIVREGEKRAETERQQMLEEIEKEIEHMLADAREDVQDMRRQAVDEFHDELIAAVLGVSAEAIGQVAPDEIHDTMLEQLTERIWEMGREEMERVRAFRRSLGERTPTAYVTTAKPLSSQQQGDLARTLSALADRSVDIQIDSDPSLSAGMRVRLADIVVDNSIAGRLELLQEEVSQALRDQLTDERSGTA
ncbi:MAG: F0F1 ATP synthase subunit delta [Anaerolineae bacterium]|jgi:F-type H+-transporting ATPase subunit b